MHCRQIQVLKHIIQKAFSQKIAKQSKTKFLQHLQLIKIQNQSVHGIFGLFVQVLLHIYL